MSINGQKPASVFARELEWQQLSGFLEAKRAGNRLAIVYGRRRQGKTMLLRSLAKETDGFYWQARQQSSAQNLASFEAALGAVAGVPSALRLNDWETAFRTLFELLGARLAVVDEVGYLLATEPSIPSHLQALLAPVGETSDRPGARDGDCVGRRRAVAD